MAPYFVSDSDRADLVAAFLFVMEGNAARQAGEPAANNPYQPGTEHWAKWLEGWNEGGASQSRSGCTGL